MKLLHLLLLALLLLPNLAIAWPNNSYSQAINISIVNGIANRQIPININTSQLIGLGSMQSDCDDIIFYVNETVQVPYWIEKNTTLAQKKECNTQSYNGTVYVKLPNTGNYNLTMLFNNPLATNISNGQSVFLFFDDFNTTTLNASWSLVAGTSPNYTLNGSYLHLRGYAVDAKAWNYTYGVEYIASAKFMNDNSGNWIAIGSYNKTSGGDYDDNQARIMGLSTTEYRATTRNAGSETNNASLATGQQQRIYSVARQNSTMTRFFYDGLSVSNNTANIATDAQYIRLKTNNPSSSMLVDWAAVANWTNDTITYSFNPIETNNIAPVVQIYTPLNNEYNQSNNNSFQYVVTDSNGIINCTLYTNRTGTWAATQGNTSAVTLGANSTIAYNFSTGGAYLWNVLCIDSANSSLAGYSPSNYTLKSDIINPTIEFVSPTPADASYINTSYLFVNASFVEQNFANCTLTLNSTNYSMTQSGTVCSYNVTGLSQGSKIINLSIADLAGRTGFTTSRNITLDLTVPTNLTWANPTPANNSAISSYIYFNLSFTDISPSTCKLELNGTNYSGTTSGHFCFYNATGLNGSEYNARMWVTDTVGFVNVSDIRHYTQYELVVNVYSESTLGLITEANLTFTNGTTSTSAVTTNGTFYANWSSVPSGAVTLLVQNSTYLPRTYFVSFGEGILGVNAYLLPNDAFSNLVRFHLNNQAGAPIQNAYVFARKFISGSYSTIAQAQTDTTGIGSIYLNINTNYQVEIQATGYADYTTYITPTTTDYYITLNNASFSPVNSTFYNVTATLNPLRFNTSVQNQNITWNVTDASGSLQNINLTLFYANGTTLYSSQVTGSPSGAMIYVIVNSSGKEPFITAQASFTKSNFSTYTISRVYSVRAYASGNYTLNNALSRAKDSTTGFSALSLWIIVILLSVLATGAISRYAPEGYGGLVAALVLTFFTGLLTGLENALMLAGLIGAAWLVIRRLSGGI